MGKKTKGPKKTTTVLECGCVYRRGKQYFLAVGPQTLLTFKDGKPVEAGRRTLSTVEVCRFGSVDALCQAWGITLEELDRATAAYFPQIAPAQRRTAPRGSRRRKQEEQEEVWRKLRQVRISQG